MTHETQDNRLLAALGYPIGLVALVMLLVKGKESPFIRYHAWQGLFWNLAWLVVGIALGAVTAIPVLGWIVGLLGALLLPLAGLALSLYYAWRAYQGEQFAIPVIGDFARQQVAVPQA